MKLYRAMPRPLKCRTIGENPGHRQFGPFGEGGGCGKGIEMTFDEFEAVRLADLEGLYQEEAARQMGVSRQTFGTILGSARKKLGEMLVLGRRLTITGGEIMIASEERVFGCVACGNRWQLPHGVQRPETCPSCGSPTLHRMSPGGGFGGGKRGGGRCHGHRTGLQARAHCCEGEGAGKRGREGETGITENKNGGEA